MKRFAILAVMGALLVGLIAAPSAPAHKLTIRAAAVKAAYYANRACNVDRYCDRFGLVGSRRQSLHVVIINIFNDRNTPAQGRYRCTRLVRVAYRTPSSRKPVLTGFGKWNC